MRLVLIWNIKRIIVVWIGIRCIRFLRCIRIIVFHQASLILGTASGKDYKKRKENYYSHNFSEHLNTSPDTNKSPLIPLF